MEPKEAQTQPKQSHFWRNSCIIGAVIGFLFVGGIIFWFVWVNFIDNPYLKTGKSNNSTNSTNSTTTATNTTSGNWKLTLVTPESMTGPETSLSGEGRATFSFSMPANTGGKFSATGDWTSHMTGSVGPSSNVADVTGKITISGTRNGNKLTFTPTYVAENCTGSTVTPIGGATTNTCDPNAQIQPHTIEIEILQNAKATKDIATNYGLYSYDYKENWTLNQVK